MEGDELVSSLSRSKQVIEVCIFLLLIVPSLVLSFFASAEGGAGFAITAFATIFRDVALVALILYLLWRNGESFRTIGWTLRNFWLEAGLGLVLFVPVFFATSYLDSLLQAAGLSGPPSPQPASLTASGPAQYILAFVLVVIVAVAEETMFRGYLILRFRAFSGMGVAAILSAFVFSLGHGYEGTSGVITVGVMGLIFAIVYLWRKSLVAPMVMHFSQDFIGIVLLPILGIG
jgi:membrane protease YdiL (CAAX protease family)